MFFRSTVDRLCGWDLSLCLACNQASVPWAVAFRLFGRLGDGPLWVALLVPVGLIAGAEGAVRLLGSLLTAAALYRITKQWTARPRPHVSCPSVRVLAAPLDRYSFPSGHTMHAASTAVVVGELLPATKIVLWPLASAIALSRVALGLHYPSDVAAGAALGAVLGLAWIW